MFAPGQNQLLANLSLLLFFKDLSIVRFYDFKKNFRGMCFTVQLSKIGFALPFVSNSFAIISCRFLPVKNFFQLFLKLFLFLSCSNFDILSHPIGCCQELFSFLFDSFVISARSLRRNSDRIPLLPEFVNSYFLFFSVFSNWLEFQTFIVSSTSPSFASSNITSVSGCP